MPTSRAIRVTSPANADSWSTIVLTVFLSSRISPRASTVIFWLRSPLATAVVTWAMFRTWLVRLPAMKLTESVRSRHVPPTPGTSACPPRRPSVPTSRATRVTSPANADSVSTIPLMVSASVATSPLASTEIFWLRSPRATAVVTWAIARTWPVRLPAIALTESVRSFQVPATAGTSAWPPSWPSVPTSRATRVTSAVNTPSCSFMALKTLGDLVHQRVGAVGQPDAEVAAADRGQPGQQLLHLLLLTGFGRSRHAHHLVVADAPAGSRLDGRGQSATARSL